MIGVIGGELLLAVGILLVFGVGFLVGRFSMIMPKTVCPRCQGTTVDPQTGVTCPVCIITEEVI